MIDRVGKHAHRTKQRRSAGFTLIEMLVSMAVLVVTLTVVGVVFSVTTKTATTAAAMAEVQAWVREWERQVTRDLKFVDPSSSVLVLVGRTQAAALTEDDLQAEKFLRFLVGDPVQVQGSFDPAYTIGPVDPKTTQYSNPRADLMMFYTMRATASQAPPLTPNNPPNPYLAGARFAPVQIVYGHAARGEVDTSTTPAVFSSNLTHIEQILGGGTDPDKHSVIPANRWHLARRATIIEPETAFNALKRSFSGPEFTRITRCQADGNNAGDVARLNWQLYLNTFGPSLARTFYLLRQRGQPYRFQVGGTGLSSNRIDAAIFDVLYPRATKDVHHVATILDEPPLELRSNLGLHMLPSCAWFQVEFLMPEDPRNSLDYYNPNPVANPPFSNRYDTPRWTEVGDDETYLFLPDTAENRRVIASSDEMFQRLADFAFTNPLNPPLSPVESRRIRLWPYAIRLTVRVYDSRNRLAEPIVRSIVHRFE